MGKIKQKPRIDLGYKKLIEVSDHGYSAVVCVECWRKRVSAYDKTFNRSAYNPLKGRFREYVYQLREIGRVAPYEKVKCVDCGRKNENDKRGVLSWHDRWF